MNQSIYRSHSPEGAPLLKSIENFFAALFIFVLTLLQMQNIHAQTTSNGSTTPIPFVGTAARAQVAPVLDGDVLNDPAYQGAAALTGFWQTAPDEGQPATERTDVRVVYTNEAIYVGVVCFDRDPKGIIVSETRRDSPLNDTDAFLMIFDTYHDRQNGFVFGTNPAGIEYDAQITNEGELSALARRSGSTGGFNLNWDGSWQVRTKTGDYGWSAEFAIPLRTLRFKGGKDQTWGVNFQRNIRRRNETAYWAKLPRQFNLHRVSLAGTLKGLDITTPQNLKVIPYVLGRSRQTMPTFSRIYSGEAGADIKYSITPSMTFDATYNTDFAQVEVDEQQVNLDRFDLFFPEKRPFFLENAGFFEVGSPGEVELFFSRRIGIGPNGIVVPIVGGARLSGKIGNTNIGALDMQTEAVQGITRANNFAVARINQELPNRSSVGVLFVNRQGAGTGAPSNDYNRLFAADARWGIGDLTQVSGYAARTVTPGRDADQYAFRVGAGYSSQAWTLESFYTEVGDNFNPEVGFLRRRSYRKTENLVFHRYRPTDLLSLQELRPHIAYRGFWNFTGFQETGFLHLDNHWAFKDGTEIHTGMNFTKEGVTNAFQLYPGITVPAGTYDHVEVQIVANTNQSASISLSSMTLIGGYFGGKRISTTPSIRVRPDDRMQIQISLNRNDVDLPAGSFVTNIVRTRISYSFTPSIFLQGLIQYNDAAKNLSANLRFGWQQSANTGLFIVFNELRDGNGGVGLQDRSIVIKYSQLVDVLD